MRQLKPMIQRVICSDYEFFMEFYKNGRRYTIEYNNSGEYELKVQAYVRFDNGEFNRYVKYDENDFKIISQTKCTPLPKFNAALTVAKPIAEPLGKLFYLDFKYNKKQDKE